MEVSTLQDFTEQYRNTSGASCDAEVHSGPRSRPTLAVSPGRPGGGPQPVPPSRMRPEPTSLGAAADPIVLAVVRLVSDPPRGVDGHEHMPFVRYREYSRWPVHAV